MDGGTITGIIQCCLAVVAIGVDVLLAGFAGQFVKNKKDKEATSKATNAINATTETSTDEQATPVLIPDKKLRNQARRILKNVKRKHKNTYPTISAISIVVAFKKLYDGNESLVVRGLNTAKQKGYLTWSGEKLLPSTIITFNANKENELIDYLGSRKS